MVSWGNGSRIRIKSKFRLALFLMVIAVIVVMMVLLPFWNRSQAMTPVCWTTFEVAAGDTLWDISLRTLPHGTDIRDYINEIRKANNMDCAGLRVGQRLRIPIW